MFNYHCIFMSNFSACIFIPFCTAELVYVVITFDSSDHQTSWGFTGFTDFVAIHYYVSHLSNESVLTHLYNVNCIYDGNE